MKKASRPGLALLTIAVLFVLIASGTVQAKVYWFEKYQRAVDMIDSGQAEDGAGLLTQLMESNPIPQNAARVPGNQYIDYLPHYQWARAQAKLGNQAEANEGLERSIRYGAVQATRRHVDDLDQLRRTIQDGLSPETAVVPSRETEEPVRRAGR